MVLIEQDPDGDTSSETGWLVQSPMNIAQFGNELAKQVGLDPKAVTLAADGDPWNASEVRPVPLRIGPRSIRAEFVGRTAKEHNPDWGWAP